MSKTENLQEITDNIKRAQNIIRTVNEVIVDLNQAAGNILQERGPINLWKGILLFDKFDMGKIKNYKIDADLKFLNEISAKAVKIKNDIGDLKSNLIKIA